MSETSGFFNSTDGDIRTYTADDFNALLSMLFTNGIVGDGLRVSREGFGVTVSSGGAIINGCWYRNTSNWTTDVSAPASTRYDRILLKYKVSDKRISLVWRKGSGSAPPSLSNSGSIIELPVCMLTVSPTTIISVTDERIFSSVRTA